LEGEHSWDLLQEIKNDSQTAAIPVLVVTVVDNKEKALALGADAFHAKPVERNWLLRQLDSLGKGDSRPQVLLVDDDDISRYLLKNMLSHSGFRFMEAVDGQEALRKARGDQPDLIILDLVMPDLSGFDVLRQLSENSATSGIPVVIHTSKQVNEEERRLLSGAVAIISKNSQSREFALELFESAFKKAGIAYPSSYANESQHA
jgi:CheY-like chemotaxis protein